MTAKPKEPNDLCKGPVKTQCRKSKWTPPPTTQPQPQPQQQQEQPQQPTTNKNNSSTIITTAITIPTTAAAACSCNYTTTTATEPLTYLLAIFDKITCRFLRYLESSDPILDPGDCSVLLWVGGLATLRPTAMPSWNLRAQELKLQRCGEIAKKWRATCLFPEK